jgi:hypothetical protein
MAVILIVRVPNRPSRPKTISIPSVRRKGWARGAGQQKIGSASSPLRSVCHNLTHARRHWVGLDDVLDCVAPFRISGFKGA